jgi:sodium transport system ATP-binding protein
LRVSRAQLNQSRDRVIHVQDLGKSFLDFQRGWVPAIREISFDCHPGEIFGLLGPNGAGKTTTLRILSTVLRPTSGRAVVAGHDVVEEPQAVRANIGYMSASTGIYDRMTAWELVEYFGRLYRMKPDSLRQRMEVIFDWLKMNDFRDVLGSKMSTGMKQKVSIARTIVHDPPVLIFDEPTSGLDVLVQRAVLQKILELRDLGKTILFSTHSMHEVEKLCARVAIIHRGQVQAEGSPRELLEQFDQPSLEELFFALVEKAETSSGLPETGNRQSHSELDASTALPRSFRERV